ncbi:MAG: hypothetical protein KDK91_29360 [Gammaproteobacteria bacterium]|nr:hypothetical protein [Gammaproteobacteria bacterium]
MIKSKLATLIGLGLISFGALAAAPAFEDVDANGDGMISATEAAAVEGLDLATADTNGDGSLSQDEYEAAAAKM